MSAVPRNQDTERCWKHPALICTGACQYLTPSDHCLNDDGAPPECRP